MDISPDLIPGYRLHERLGAGGMGAVFRARQVALDRWVAVKIMKRELAEDREYVRRFLAEAKTAGRLRHENIVGALDCGGAGGHYYIVMELVEGRSLDAILKERGRLPEREALELGRRVARALQYAWEHKIVHRDIKPQNILVTADGTPKICDLGLCRDVAAQTKLTTTGAILCTPAYASPEQARGERNLDTRSDLYSLGVTLYELTTGSLPFPGESPGEILIHQATKAPPPPITRNPSLSAVTNELILDLLEKDPASRPATPGAVAERIDVILAGRAHARPPKRPRAAPRRAPVRAIATGVGVAAILVIGLLALRPEPPWKKDWKRLKSLGVPATSEEGASRLDEWRKLSERHPETARDEREFRDGLVRHVHERIASARKNGRLTEAWRIGDPLRSLPVLQEIVGELEAEIRKRFEEDAKEIEAGRRERHAGRLDEAARRMRQYGCHGSRWFSPELFEHCETAERLVSLLRNLPSTPMIAFSYRSQDEARAELAICGLQGEGRKVLFSTKADVLDPAWSHDGCRIAFHDREMLSVAFSDGTGLESLPGTRGIDSKPSWSPDDRKLAYSAVRDGRSRVYVYDLASRRDQVLVEDESSAPDWSPDGTMIACIADGKVLIVDAKTARPLWKVGVNQGARNVTWAPDGLKLSCVCVTSRGTLAVVVMAVRTWSFEITLNLAHTVADVSPPAWSPAGDRLVFSVNVKEGSDIYIAESGYHARFVTQNPGRVRTLSPTWIPARK